AGPRHVVLDEDAVLEHGDLGAVVVLSDHHGAVHRLPTGEELRLGQDRRAGAALFAAVASPLPLGLQPGRAADPPHLVARRPGLAHLDDGDDAVLAGRLSVAGTPAAATAATAGERLSGLG